MDETASFVTGSDQRHHGCGGRAGRGERRCRCSGRVQPLGRILDYNRAALEALPEVLDAIGGKTPVLLDSGIRSGGDIVKALALGARAVLVGRPIAWGVGAFGARGVERVFAILTEEMQRVLTLTGVARIRDITRSILFREERGGLRGL